MFKPLILVVLTFNVQLIRAADFEMKTNTSQTKIKILGQSGKMTITPPKGDAVMVTMDFLRELDANGNEVGKSGSKKHSINTFAAQDFTFTNKGLVNYENVSTNAVDFSTSISTDIGKLDVMTYIFRNNGTVGTDTERWKVIFGDIKFNLFLSNWKWCGDQVTCGNGKNTETGAFIDVGIEIKSKSEPKKQKGKNGSFALGDGIDLQLSSRVLIDGVWKNMPAGFPSLEVKNGKSLFTFRFPKFTTDAKYDPVMHLSESSPTSSSGSAASIGTKSNGSRRSCSLALFSLTVILALLNFGMF